ncbi:MAG: hypothetical protein SGJ10_09835 [Bacteroidota bacterium]|nr:hypothetical protein [Bacteroidota bacterium]
MTDIQFLENNLNAFEKQLGELKDIKVKQLHVLHDLEQLEQKYEKQIAAVKEYLGQTKIAKEFLPIEAVAELVPLAPTPPQVEPTIEERPATAFEEILPEPKVIVEPKQEIKDTNIPIVNKENVNEKLAKVRKQSTVEKLNHTKIEDLRKSLNLNSTMAFTKTFFGGENSQFSIFIDALNTCGSFDAANTIIQSQIDAKKNPELYDDLIHLAQRRWQ